MTFQIVPHGTYGITMPNPPEPLKSLMHLFARTQLRLKGKQLIDVITVGSKSGKTYTNTLVYMEDGRNSWIVIASAGGATKHPNWYFNMAHNPEQVWVELDGQKIQVTAESLEGDDYKTMWDMMAAYLPQYNDYAKTTDRHIPVIRLTRKK
jgi:deazaflavin-dependent oxidoreductase (nitroreductase family)